MLSPVPVSSADQARLGREIYNTLGMTLASHRDWFAEGLPHEWLLALDALQAVLTRAKKRAARAMEAAQEAHPAQPRLL
jgi:hypothetical protein